MRNNVVIGAALQERIEADSLIVTDYFVLALADCMAAMFSSATVYTDPVLQETPLPTVVVIVYPAAARQTMGNGLVVEIQIEVSYFAAKKQDTGELSAAAMAMLETPRELFTEIGAFALLGRTATIDHTEGKARMICRAEARLATPNNDELMQILKQGVK